MTAPSCGNADLFESGHLHARHCDVPTTSVGGTTDAKRPNPGHRGRFCDTRPRGVKLRRWASATNWSSRRGSQAKRCRFDSCLAHWTNA